MLELACVRLDGEQPAPAGDEVHGVEQGLARRAERRRARDARVRAPPVQLEADRADGEPLQLLPAELRGRCMRGDVERELGVLNEPVPEVVCACEGV